MKVINNKYILSNVLEEQYHWVKYHAYEKYNKEKKYNLKLYNASYNDVLMNIFIKEYLYSIKQIKHRGAISFYDFDIAEYIDGNKIDRPIYFSISGAEPHINTPLDQILNVENIQEFFASMYNVIDFLIFSYYRGFNTEMIESADLVIVKDKGFFQIKVLDPASLLESHFGELSNFSNPDEFKNYFLNSKSILSPVRLFHMFSEILEPLGDMEMAVAIKAYLKHFLTTYKSANLIEDEAIKVYQAFKDFLKAKIKNQTAIGMFYHNEKVALNLKGAMAGRRISYAYMTEVVKKFESKISSTKILLIRGEEGIGKTRFLRETDFYIKMLGKKRLFISGKGENHGEKTMAMIFSELVKEAASDLVQKYEEALSFVIPTMGEGANQSLYAFHESNLKMKMFRQLVGFLNELAAERQLYILVDDADTLDEDFMTFLNFMVEMPGKNNYLFILTETKQLKNVGFSEKSIESSNENIETIELLRLTINEIGEMIRNLLCVQDVPISYMAKMFKFAGGVPALIEQVLTKQLNNKELIKKEGQYNFEKADFNNIILESMSQHLLNDVIKGLSEEEQEILKYMALFNKMISLEIIEKIFEEKTNKIIITLMQLVDKGIFQVQLDDTGYTYTFTDQKLKLLLFYAIEEKEKQKMHGSIAEALMDYYNSREERLAKGLTLYEEICTHYIGTGKKEEALSKIIYFAEELNDKYGEFQSIYLWEKAFGLVESLQTSLDMKIYLSLAKAYDIIGKTHQAVTLLAQVIEKESIDFELSCDARMSYAKILIQKEDVEKAEVQIAYINKNKERIGDIEIIFQMVQHHNSILLKSRKYEDVLLQTAFCLEEAERIANKKYIGIFYNQIGLSLLFMVQVQSAESYFQRAVKALREIAHGTLLAKPLNNLGLIYAEYYFELEKAVDYYKEALKFSRESSRNTVTAGLLINIAQIYIIYGNFEEAEGMLCEAEKVATEVQDGERIFSAQVNLAVIFLRMGKFSKSYQYIQKIGKEKISILEQREDFIRYKTLLVEFSYSMSDLPQIESHSIDIQQSHNEFYRYFIYASQIWKILMEYHLSQEKFTDEILNFGQKIVNTPYYDLIRKFLLATSYVALNKKNFHIYQTYMDLDAQFQIKFDNEYFQIYREMLGYIYEEDIQSLERLLKRKELERFFKLSYYIIYQISTYYTENERHYEALNGYLSCLYKLLINIQDIDDVACYEGLLKGHSADAILMKIHEIKCSLDSDFKPIPPEELRDIGLFSENYKKLQLNTLFENETFLKTMPTPISAVSDVDTLITTLTEENEKNIDLMKALILSQTQGERCLITAFSQEDNDEYAELLHKEEWASHYRFNDFISNLQDNDVGFIIKKDIFEHNETDHLLRGNAMAAIFVPIYKTSHLLHKNNYERRNTRKKLQEEIIGFIFVETSNILNYFNEAHLDLLHVISHLIYIELRNYQLKMTSYIDKLTKVYTRQYFEREFSRIYAKYSDANATFSVIMADIDKFKNINDIFGHQKGDKILSAVSQIIKNNVRQSDVVGRYGGEEFIIILPDCNGEEAFYVAENIRRDIEANLKIDGSYKVTISQGISNFPLHTQMREEMIPKADQALYYAKDNGRNQTAIWNKGLSINNSRMDKLEGIVTGNIVQDQRMALVVMEISDIVIQKTTFEEKAYSILGRLLEYMEAWQGGIILLEPTGEIKNRYYRERKGESWIDKIAINENNFKQTIATRRGQFMIDWDSDSTGNQNLGAPNWQSMVMAPLIKEGENKGIIFFNVSAQQHEFGYKALNFLEFSAKIIAGIL